MGKPRGRNERERISQDFRSSLGESGSLRCWHHATAMSRTLAAAFFRADFDQALGKKNKASHLDPFRKNVADHLAPLALRVHRPKQKGPSKPCDHDEYQKRMPMQKIQPGGTLFSFNRPALSRSDFIQKFRSQDNDH